MHSSTCVVFCIIKLFFKKTLCDYVRGYQKFSMTKWQEKSPLVILIGWSLDITRYLEFTRPEKDPRLLAWHGKWKDPENGRAWKWATRDVRGYFSSDKNSDKFNERERDYWWSQKAYILERQHWSIYCAKSKQPWWTRRTKEKFVWTVKPRRHAAKVQSP